MFCVHSIIWSTDMGMTLVYVILCSAVEKESKHMFGVRTLKSTELKKGWQYIKIPNCLVNTACTFVWSSVNIWLLKQNIYSLNTFQYSENKYIIPYFYHSAKIKSILKFVLYIKIFNLLVVLLEENIIWCIFVIRIFQCDNRKKLQSVSFIVGLSAASIASCRRGRRLPV